MTKNNIILALVAAGVLAVGAYAYYQSGVEVPATNTTGNNSQDQGNTVTTTSGNSNDDISADFNATSVQSSDSSFQSVDGDINKL